MMIWQWGPSNFLWQATHTYGQFNPLQLLSPRSAQAWYAQQSAANWQSGTMGGHVLAVVQDGVGGYVSAWTGNAASGPQTWWSTGMGMSISKSNPYTAISNALCSSIDSLTGGQQLSPATAAVQLAGLGHDFLVPIAAKYPTSIVFGSGNQYQFTFAPANLIAKGQQLGFNASCLGVIGRAGGVTQSVFDTTLGKFAPPNVGGILLDREAVLLDAGELVGAYWDAAAGCLVLLEKMSGGNVALRLPGLDRDHLIVALRAALAGQPIGVSIDPPSEFRDGNRRGETPPDGTPMLVSYLGGTDGTLFGAIMFEADRLLKCLDKGVHNETRKPVRASVPGFKPLLEMIAPGDEHAGHVWHRFWFVIDRVELRRDATSAAIRFGDVKLKVLAETEMEACSQQERIDPADRDFASHLSDHYDEYAKDFPVLARLKELAKIAAVAKFLVNGPAGLDAAGIFDQPPIAVNTPATTPGISVVSPNVAISRVGNQTLTRSISLFGGVDMDADPHVLPDADAKAEALRYLAENARPGAGASAWTFDDGADRIRAAAINLGSQRGPFRRVCDDHQFGSSTAGRPFALRRVYDSTLRRTGDFGPGWKLWIPFSISPIPRSGKRREVLTRAEMQTPSCSSSQVVLFDNTSGEVRLYRSIDNKTAGRPQTLCKITSQTCAKGRYSFTYDAADRIHLNKDGYTLEREGFQFCFNLAGELVEIRRDSGCIVRYHRHDGRIAQISDAFGHAYEFRYDPRGFISEALAGDGTFIHYTYDDEHFLISFEIDREVQGTYAYDACGRLVEVSNGQESVILHNVYDDIDHPIGPSGRDVVSAESGARISRRMEHDRVVSANDTAGARADFEYESRGRLSNIAVSDPGGRSARFSYDRQGRLNGIENGNGRSIRFRYDRHGRVVEVLDSGCVAAAMSYDAKGRLDTIVDPVRGTWKTHYDENGRVTGIDAPGDKAWRIRYANSHGVVMSTPRGAMCVSARREIMELWSHAHTGVWRRMLFDRALRMIAAQFSAGIDSRIRCETANSFAVKNACGTIQYEIDESKSSATVRFMTR